MDSLNYQHLVSTTRANERGLSQIIEHWLPWQGDSASTIRTEERVEPSQPQLPKESRGMTE